MTSGFEESFYEPFASQWEQQGYYNAEEVWNEFGGAYFDYDQFYGVKEDTLTSRMDTSIAGLNKRLAHDVNMDAMTYEAKNLIGDTMEAHKLNKIKSKEKFDQKMYENQKKNLLHMSLDKLSEFEGKIGKHNLTSSGITTKMDSIQSIINDKISQGAKANNWRQKSTANDIENIIRQGESEAIISEAINTAKYDMKTHDVSNRIAEIELRGTDKINALRNDWLAEQYNIVGTIFSQGPEGPNLYPELPEYTEVADGINSQTGEPCDISSGDPFCNAVEGTGGGGGQLEDQITDDCPVDCGALGMECTNGTCTEPVGNPCEPWPECNWG
jgi:hypothetical protein